jgi:hypothetical protein
MDLPYYYLQENTRYLQYGIYLIFTIVFAVFLSKYLFIRTPVHQHLQKKTMRSKADVGIGVC